MTNIKIYRISKITTGWFPLRNTIEKIFMDILKERYSICGLMVKNTLVEDHHLDRLFEFLRALFLFSDGSLFPFFQQFFSEVIIFHLKFFLAELLIFYQFSRISMDIFTDGKPAKQSLALHETFLQSEGLDIGKISFDFFELPSHLEVY